eukprot:15370920-Heterocapsa_arctica.AAC.1
MGCHTDDKYTNFGIDDASCELGPLRAELYTGDCVDGDGAFYRGFDDFRASTTSATLTTPSQTRVFAERAFTHRDRAVAHQSEWSIVMGGRGLCIQCGVRFAH